LFVTCLFPEYVHDRKEPVLVKKHLSTSLRLYFARKPSRSLSDLRIAITQMSRIDVQGPVANAIFRIAPDSGRFFGEIWDVPAVLLVAGVAEQCHADDLALDILTEDASVANDIVHDSSTLRVATGNEDSAAGCLFESFYSLLDAGGVGALIA